MFRSFHFRHPNYFLGNRPCNLSMRKHAVTWTLKTVDINATPIPSLSLRLFNALSLPPLRWSPLLSISFHLLLSHFLFCMVLKVFVYLSFDSIPPLGFCHCCFLFWNFYPTFYPKFFRALKPLLSLKEKAVFSFFPLWTPDPSCYVYIKLGFLNDFV